MALPEDNIFDPDDDGPKDFVPEPNELTPISQGDIDELKREAK